MKKAVVVALAAIMVLSVAGVALADTVSYPGTQLAPGRYQATNSGDPVDVKVTVNPKITLTVDTPDAAQSVDFGSVDPGTTGLGGKTVGLSVNSNKRFDLTVAEDVTNFAANDVTLHRTLANTANNAKGQNVTFSDAYSIDTAWTTEPGAYTATVTYTVTQQ